MHVAASVHSAHQRQRTVYGTGSNLDRERTDFCEEGTKCSRYLYIFDHKNTELCYHCINKNILYLYVQ